MSDVYNIAVRYLVNKYPGMVYRTENALNRLRKARNLKEKKSIEATFTENDFIKTYSKDLVLKSNNTDDISIHLLVEQYYLGIKPKYELENLLKFLKIIS